MLAHVQVTSVGDVLPNSLRRPECPSASQTPLADGRVERLEDPIEIDDALARGQEEAVRSLEMIGEVGCERVELRAAGSAEETGDDRFVLPG